VVDETTDGKSLMKNRSKRGPNTMTWGTPAETVVAADDGPSSKWPYIEPNRFSQVPRAKYSQEFKLG
jgi:hypothetical protein